MNSQISDDEHALAAAINDGDRLAVLALADLRESQGDDLAAESLRWCVRRGIQPEEFPEGNGFLYSWVKSYLMAYKGHPAAEILFSKISAATTHAGYQPKFRDFRSSYAAYMAMTEAWKQLPDSVLEQLRG